MKAHLTLAEAAAAHPDGTMSILRAGIDRVMSEHPPYTLHAALVVRIQSEIGDVGKHRFDIKGLDQDGQGVLPALEGEFEVPQGGGTSAFILGMHVVFEKAGTYLFVLRVDNVQLDDWTLHVGQRAKE